MSRKEIHAWRCIKSTRNIKEELAKKMRKRLDVLDQIMAKESMKPRLKSIRVFTEEELRTAKENIKSFIEIL